MDDPWALFYIKNKKAGKVLQMGYRSMRAVAKARTRRRME